MKLADLWQLVKETGTQFIHDKAPRLGAALAFYIALSISPVLMLVIAIAGFAFGEEAARGELAQQMRTTVGDEGAAVIQSMLAANHSGGKNVLMTVVSIATLIVGATGVFAQLQDALDTVWNVKPEHRSRGILGMIKDRLLSFSIVCSLAFLLLVSLVLSAVLSAIDRWVEGQVPFSSSLLQLGNHLLSFALATVLFAIMFKVLPHARPAWSDVWIGALITSALFTLGKYLIGLYLGQAAPGSAYGAAGSFVVLLIWIYYSTQIVLFGAEFTEVYAKRLGSGMGRDNASGTVNQPSPSLASAH